MSKRNHWENYWKCFLSLILAAVPPIQLLIFIEWFLGYVLSSYHIVSYLILTEIPRDRYYYCQFSDGDTEVQRIEVIHPKPHSYQWPGKNWHPHHRTVSSFLTGPASYRNASFIFKMRALWPRNFVNKVRAGSGRKPSKWKVAYSVQTPGLGN